MRVKVLLVAILMVTGMLGGWRQASASVVEPQNVSAAQQEDDTDFPPIPQDAIRLRIIANSDSPDDQSLKRSVRDRVIYEVGRRMRGLQTPEQARSVLLTALPELDKIARDVLQKEGSAYTLKTDFGTVPFPTKLYGDKVYPAGNYEALRMVIGKGQGQNWWCVLFPALCFVDIANGDAIQAKDMATGKPLATISIPNDKGAMQQVQIRSGLLDWLSGLWEKVITWF